jgi:excisionase family DNA binding protein
MDTKNKDIQPRLLSVRQVAALCGVSDRTVASWRSSGRLKAVKMGERCIRYAIEDVNAMIEDRKEDIRR